jgi:short-subunit dehydrogenase
VTGENIFRPSQFTHYTRRMHARKTVFITGASSGIGYHLALEFAKRGYNLALAARRIDALVELKRSIELRHRDCGVHIQALDVTNYDGVAASLQAAHSHLGGFDIVVANAGIGSLGRVGHGHFADHRRIIETNVLGAMATCDAAIKLFKQQKRGQLVVISSVAAFRGLANSSAYSASKAAITTYAESIRVETHGSEIRITTIFPGFIDTPINQSNPNRPFLITVEKGAKLIADKIERGVSTAVVPTFPWTMVKWLAGAIPTALLARRGK